MAFQLVASIQSVSSTNGSEFRLAYIQNLGSEKNFENGEDTTGPGLCGSETEVRD